MNIPSSNFDQLIDRTTVSALKFDSETLTSVFGTDQLWPSWVADMDFTASPAIQDALRQRLEHGIYGYENSGRAIPEAVASWCRKRHGWTFDPDHLLFTPRTLTSIAAMIEHFSQEGDGVIVQPPVFYDFKNSVKALNRKLVKNPLKLVDGRYQMDFSQLESVASDPANRLLILCNPHNPIGRVWERESLETLARLCAANDVFIISDEIHGDITFSQQYVPLALASGEFAANCATCLSAVKAFNLAGLANSMLVIEDDARRDAVNSWLNRYDINKNNVFTTVATQAAYTQGEPWLNQVTAYIEDNVSTLRTFLEKRIPAINLIEPEGTFLVWLDCRELGLAPDELATFLVEQAAIAGNPGHWFGREGAGFVRINVACPTEVLLNALQQLALAVDRLKS